MSKFVVTIARGYGSGGRTIGKMLAKKLGVSYYDKEILSIASEDSGINESLFAMHDEKAKPTLFKRSKVYSGELIPPDSDDFTSAENLFNYQAKAIKELAAKESCIIVGRCADHILSGEEGVLRVFIWADTHACVDNVMNLCSMTKDEALRSIEKIDRERRAYYKLHTGNEWDDVRNYDLCLNTTALGFEKCVEIISSYIDIMNK